eukprot:Pompholyxophrys_punicea_v1_NODE_598_length_1615_cov_3.942308.p2 type:complete len:130 gc:universal NODE_598_length_1615_cov_3.942308:468-857(+)
MDSKWGFDGSGSQKIYIQTLPTDVEVSPDDASENEGVVDEENEDVEIELEGTGNEKSQKFTEKSMFATTTIPLKIFNENYVFWTNPTLNSTRFCRPVKLEFAKESFELWRASGPLVHPTPLTNPFIGFL